LGLEIEGRKARGATVLWTEVIAAPDRVARENDAEFTSPSSGGAKREQLSSFSGALRKTLRERDDVGVLSRM